MAAKCDTPPYGRYLSWKLPEKLSSDIPSRPKRSKTTSESFSGNVKLGRNHSDDQTAQTKMKQKRKIAQRKAECIEKEETFIDSNTEWSLSGYPSLEFPSHSQDELKEIYGERTQRHFKLIFDSKELESSEEEEGISDGELEQTDGWKLLMAALDSKFEKRH